MTDISNSQSQNQHCLTPWLDDGDVRLYQGDAAATLFELPAGIAHTCVTSPPYYGLRDYGTGDAQIGLEDTPDAYIARLVDVFRAVRHVLRDDGTLWLNLGDSYASGSGTLGRNDAGRDLTGGGGNREGTGNPGFKGLHRRETGAKPKDLLGMPWRVALALQADGWYLRSDIIWHKPNPMPESVTDRPTKAHEYLFLLAKSQRYYYDADAIREPISPDAHLWGGKAGRGTGTHGPTARGGRNKRTVWTVPTQPYTGAHFAVFPPALIEPCILAGCTEGGVVLDPFMGSGTTAHTARRLGRRSIGTELNPAYLELAAKRLQQQSLFGNEAA